MCSDHLGNRALNTGPDVHLGFEGVSLGLPAASLDEVVIATDAQMSPTGFVGTQSRADPIPAAARTSNPAASLPPLLLPDPAASLHTGTP